MVKSSELLNSLAPIIEKRIMIEIVRGSLLQDEITNQIHQFFNDLVQAVETGDPSWLDSMLEVWANSLTQTDLENENNVTNEFINRIVSTIHETIVENLQPEEALKLNTLLLPIYAYLFSRTADIETSQKVQYLSKQIERVKLDLKKLDDSKSNFVAVAAHELKTPLTLIDGYVSMLIDIILKQNQTSLLTYTNGILSGSKRLRNIIEDMIDISLLENNLLHLNYQPFWLNRILEYVLLEASATSKEREIEIKVEEFDGLFSINYGDSARLIQLFKNLITNAIKFTPDGGRIIIRGKKLTGFIDVQIVDNGIGIDPDDQNAIFEKFNRLGNIALHSSSKTKFKGGGPGLGLPIARGIAEAHGGSIWVESPGYSEIDFPGSTFHVLIPVLEKLPQRSDL